MNETIDTLLVNAPATPDAPVPAWVSALQSRDKERFRQYGLPHKRLEDWKYTPLARLPSPLEGASSESGGAAPAVYGPAVTGPASTGFALSDTDDAGDALHTVTLLDGVPQGAPGADRPGLSVQSLGTALDEDDDAWRALVESLDTGSPSLALSALNTAHLGPGLALRVAAGVDAGTVFLDWRSSAGQGPIAQGAVNARVLVLLEPGARLDLVERFASPGFTNVVNQWQLGADSRLRHARLQENPSASWLVTRTEALFGEGSELEQASLDLGGGLARHDLRARMAAPGARCTALGAYLTDGAAHVDHHLDVRHEAPGCSSEQTFRGVLHGESRAVFNGRVHVLPGADDSEAHQSNQNLLLSRSAEVNTKPELIIEADEVVASHGATVGQLDETAVFYLRSRGIEEGHARRMLTTGFCRSVVEAMGNARARAAFATRLDEALEAIT